MKIRPFADLMWVQLNFSLPPWEPDGFGLGLRQENTGADKNVTPARNSAAMGRALRPVSVGELRVVLGELEWVCVGAERQKERGR